MPATPRYPTDHVPTVVVRAAAGRFEDFATIIGPRRPDVRTCWCTAYRDSRVAPDERGEYMRDLCASEPGPGVLVYVDDVVAGWCSVAPHATYRRLVRSRTIPQPDDTDGTWSIVCFVVRAGYRKHGLMHRLLDGAAEHAAAHGASAVEGYPVATGSGRVDVISGYVGTVGLFERAGFERGELTSSRVGGQERYVLRRTLR